MISAAIAALHIRRLNYCIIKRSKFFNIDYVPAAAAASAASRFSSLSPHSGELALLQIVRRPLRARDLMKRYSALKLWTLLEVVFQLRLSMLWRGVEQSG